LGLDSSKLTERISKLKKAEKMSALTKRRHAEIESDEDKMIDEEE